MVVSSLDGAVHSNVEIVPILSSTSHPQMSPLVGDAVPLRVEVGAWER